MLDLVPDVLTAATSMNLHYVYLHFFPPPSQHQALTEAMSVKKHVNNHMHWDLLLYVALHLKEPPTTALNQTPVTLQGCAVGRSEGITITGPTLTLSCVVHCALVGVGDRTGTGVQLKEPDFRLK